MVKKKKRRYDLWHNATHQGKKMNVIIGKKETRSNLAQFLHGTCPSPVKSTFLKVINNKHFTSWPGLDKKLIKKHLLPSMATEVGHLNKKR